MCLLEYRISYEYSVHFNLEKFIHQRLYSDTFQLLLSQLLLHLTYAKGIDLCHL